MSNFWRDLIRSIGGNEVPFINNQQEKRDKIQYIKEGRKKLGLDSVLKFSELCEASNKVIIIQ